ncbi:MAG: DUF4124 domain-containing protein [Chitinophagaceae bacterium]|nr:DUF4124 domain-containing protein [Rubrivivax sp.]
MGRAILVAIALAIALPAAAQTVYRCTGANGEPAFQAHPCAGGKQIKIPETNVVDSRPDGEAGLRALVEGERARNAQIRLGMTEKELVRAWGLPKKINTDLYGSGVQKQLS